MKKFLITILLCAPFCCANAQTDNVGIGGSAEAEDWVSEYAEGNLAVTVSVDNSAAVSVSVKDSTTPMTLVDGINKVSVPVDNRELTIKANEGYAIVSVTVGNTSATAVNGVYSVPCEADQKVVIVTKKNDQSVLVPTLAADENSKARYFNMGGMEISEPQAGCMYIVLKNGKAVKVRK